APFDETVESVPVENGDMVEAGTPLISLQVDGLNDELSSAWLELTKARQALRDLVKQSSTTALMEANAELLAAQEDLRKLEEGPSQADSRAAQLAISDAQLAYEDLINRNDPNAKDVRLARFELRQRENDVQRAQTAYDAVAWRGDVAASAEAAALQSATIAHENARDAYEEAIKPPTELEVQKALNTIAQAQSTYDKLFTEATAAQIEQAKVRVAKAEEALAEVQAGPTSLATQEAENNVMTTLNRVEELRAKLRRAGGLQAPVDGQVVKLAVSAGDVVKEGDTLAVVVVPDEFKLTLAVSELFILRIAQGMPVNIRLDVLPGQAISGTVSVIAPPEVQTGENTTAGQSGSTQLTTYPVTVVVDDGDDVARLRAGMSAQVTFVGSNQLPPNSWLVPANGLALQAEGVGVVQVMRDGTPTPLEVEVTDITQGEWVVVVSPTLAEGDVVQGSTSSFLDQQQNPFGR
ncbi:MAG TPA: HlyD family efflux transporter periplasmic adaptor subunit, partial [Caldilineaceae bacterium]|nr:HlyD family efflux transporter periplasmic adaptor subunit [Caldilineaceae bacterium]